LEEADDLTVHGIGGHAVPGFQREGWRAGFDNLMQPRGHGAIRFRHLGYLRKHVFFPSLPILLGTCVRLQLFGALLRRGAFKSWLFCIARNKVIDYRRKRKVVSPLEDDLEGDGNDWDPLKDLEQAEDFRRLAVMVKKLPAEQVEYLRLRFVGHLSYAQIGQVVGKREDAVRMAITRLLAHLRKEWERDDE
jgi:RNA polymerase sigma factor (sigma-70 family)